MLFSCREEGQDTEGMEKTVQSGYAQVAIKSVLDRKRETDRKTDRKKEIGRASCRERVCQYV